jgi:hypothetical protein
MTTTLSEQTTQTFEVLKDELIAAPKTSCSKRFWSRWGRITRQPTARRSR